uniref:Uncharacterized protein n=1 Tax=Setaria italica TaxID=4555 RepID=K3XP51_SETIT
MIASTAILIVTYNVLLFFFFFPMLLQIIVQVSHCLYLVMWMCCQIVNPAIAMANYGWMDC